MDKSHHAYVLEGERKSLLGELSRALKNEWEVRREGNPDFFVFEYETLSVDDSREIKELAGRKAFAGVMIVIIACNFIGREAQNALLKTFEEPGEGVYFFVIVPNKEVLLSTVRSRLLPFQLGQRAAKGAVKISPEVSKFLKSSAEERLKQLSGFLSHENETKKSDLLDFVSEIEKEMAPDFRSRKSGAELEELLNLKKYLFDRSPSVKMIAEYLALRLPQAGKN